MDSCSRKKKAAPVHHTPAKPAAAHHAAVTAACSATILLGFKGRPLRRVALFLLCFSSRQAVDRRPPSLLCEPLPNLRFHSTLSFPRIQNSRTSVHTVSRYRYTLSKRVSSCFGRRARAVSRAENGWRIEVAPTDLRADTHTIVKHVSSKNMAGAPCESMVACSGASRHGPH